MNQLRIDGTENVEVVAIGKTEARELVTEIQDRSEELWHKLFEAYHRGAHTALGYPSWGTFFEAEFGGSRTRAYALLDAGRVVKALESANPACGTEQMPNARQAEELAPLVKKDPDAAVEAWHEAVEDHGEEVTATDVREVVTRKQVSPVWSQEERELAEQLLEGKTVVVNMRSEVHPRLIKWANENGKFVKVDRRSEWGNPFEMPGDGDRETVIQNYEEHYLPFKPSLTSRLADLRGKALGCWCAPESCHGHVLQRLAYTDAE